MNCGLPRTQAGLTLVELLIALLLGVIITAAAGQILISTKNVYRMQEDISRIQEGGRFAVDLLSHDIRMAGYVGCGSLNRVDVNVIAKNSGDWRDLDANNFIRGEDNVSASNALGAKPGTDFIQIKGAMGSGVRLYPETVTNANIKIEGNPFGFKRGDVLMVTDCVNADIFSVVGISNAATKVTIAHSAAGNTSNFLSTQYGSDAEVVFFQMMSYYVKPSGRKTSAGRDIDSLWLRIHGGNVSATPGFVDLEVVEGVENLQIEYGLDTNGDRAVNEFRTAAQITSAAQWGRVVAVRFSLLMAGNGEKIIATSGAFAQSLNYNGAAVSADGVMRKVFDNVVAVRNRIP